MEPPQQDRRPWRSFGLLVFCGANLAYGVFAADHDRSYWWVTMSGYGCVFILCAVQLMWSKKPRTALLNDGSDS